MNTRLLRTFTLPACALAMLLSLTPTAPAAAAARPVDTIVAFGDSLSDPGNAFVLRRTLSTPPYDTLDALAIPDAPYARGGHHYSNGATWIEELARGLALGRDARPGFQIAGKGSNYAVGSARAREDGKNVNLGAQVDAFLADAGGVAPADALYVIEIGGNDVHDALSALGAGGDPTAVLGAALQAVGEQIGALYTAGARQFLVWNVPDLRLTPAIRTLDAVSPGASTAVGMLTQGYNAGLAGLIASLATLPGAEFTVFDAFATIREIAADPAAYGLRVANAACVTPGIAPYQCRQPDAYLFWDGFHPTSAAHRIIAQQVGSLISQ